jgi:hypothetical protein
MKYKKWVNKISKILNKLNLIYEPTEDKVYVLNIPQN